MLKVGFFIWKLSGMPKDPMELVYICKKFNIKILAIKVVEYLYNYNTPEGDKPLIDYINVLRNNDVYKIEVEGWGYHYPDKPGPQGEKIEERRQKLGLEVYHFNCENEWQKPYGMPAAMKTMLDKPKLNNFEMLLCSYRYPSLHSLFPFNAAMNHPTTDGASPQVYWALSNDPVNQLKKTLTEYSQWPKTVHPLISTFGATFQVKDKKIYWEPTIEEIKSIREECYKQDNITKMYCWSLDWVLSHKRFDMIEAATGYNDDSPPIEPPPEKEYFTITNCKFLNGRSEIAINPDNVLVIVKAGQQVKNLKIQNGQWNQVSLGKIIVWMHGDYLD